MLKNNIDIVLKNESQKMITKKIMLTTNCKSTFF